MIPSFPFSLPNICIKKVIAAFDGGTISSDGGVFLWQRCAVTPGVRENK
jgi:hypothetical protein